MPEGFLIRKNIRLSRYTTFRIGGPADFFVTAKSFKAFKNALAFANDQDIPFFILGGGSNLLVCDRGFRGLVIKNSLKGITRHGNSIRARSGEKLSRVLDFAADQGLTGFEFAAGIPGTLGGAVYGNAGAYGKAIGDLLIRAKLMNRQGAILEADRDFFRFSYRYSRLKARSEIVLEVDLELAPGDPVEIHRQMDEIIAERKKKHPSREWGCAGSYFKNLDPKEAGQRRTPAGLLLEQVGAKGLSCGKAVVFPGHANFLTNPGGATAKDVLALAGELKKRVKKAFGIDLEEEVLYVDECIRSFEQKEGCPPIGEDCGGYAGSNGS